MSRRDGFDPKMRLTRAELEEAVREAVATIEAGLIWVGIEKLRRSVRCPRPKDLPDLRYPEK